jgi:histidinol-phosphate phosphatase family protein
MMKLIILDRDGVINHDSEAFIKSPDEWIPLPGSLEAIARLNQAGYRVVVATNQSGVGRGLFDMATLNAIHQKMHTSAQQVGADIDAVFFCPHTQDDNCDCRKPKPGMMLEIARRFEINLRDRGRRFAARPAGGIRRRLPAVSGADRQRGKDRRQGRLAARHHHLRRPGRGCRNAARQSPVLARRAGNIVIMCIPSADTTGRRPYRSPRRPPF